MNAAADKQTLPDQPDADQTRAAGTERTRGASFRASLGASLGHVGGSSRLSSPRGATTVRLTPGAPVTPTNTWINESRRIDRLGPTREKWAARAVELGAVRPPCDKGTWNTSKVPAPELIAAYRDRLGAASAEWETAPSPSQLDERVAFEALKIRRQANYAVARVGTLTRELLPRLMACSSDAFAIKCQCAGDPRAVFSMCRQWFLCEECRKQRSPKLQAWLVTALRLRLDEETARWAAEGGRSRKQWRKAKRAGVLGAYAVGRAKLSGKPMIQLVTLTAPHSGDIAVDREAISVAWRATYKRMHDDYGKFPYAFVWEVTPGRDGKGHVHAHVAVIWRRRPWKRVRVQWTRALARAVHNPGLVPHLSFVAGRRDGRPSTASSVANYIGKYLSKGVDKDARFTAEQRADISAAFYNQRTITTSVGFWEGIEKRCRCRDCREFFRRVDVARPVLAWRLPEHVIRLDFTRGPPSIELVDP